MGMVRVIVLRLFVDPTHPDRLAGSLRCVPDGVTLPFAGERALLAALRHLAEDRGPVDGSEAPALDDLQSPNAA